MICYYIFNAIPDADLIVGVQDQAGRSLGPTYGVELTPHPFDEGHWRLGPFYIADDLSSEFSAGEIR